jgi:hypothetical protein
MKVFLYVQFNISVIYFNYTLYSSKYLFDMYAEI